MRHIIIGILFVVGGLSGQLALIGTNSSGALVVVGFGLAGWGIFKMVRAKADSGPGPGLGPGPGQP